MPIYWDAYTQFLSHPITEATPLWAAFYPFSECSCWNCTGRMYLQRKTLDSFDEIKPCWTCAAIGVLNTTEWTIGAQLDWFINPQDYDIRYPGGGSDIWEPF